MGDTLGRFNWLHFSDLHLGGSNSLLLRPEYRGALENDLRKLHERSGPWHLIVISGDLTVSGSKREFELLNSSFESLGRFMLSLGSNPCLLVVPGDHDLFRGPPLQAGGATSLRDGFQDFSDWFTSWRLTHVAPKAFRDGLVPGDFTATLINEGLKIGVVGLNSVLRLAPGGAGRTREISFLKVEESLGVKLQEWALQHDMVLLLTHFSSEMISDPPLALLYRKLSPQRRPFLHLCGNQLDKKWGEILGLASTTRAVQMPSLFSVRRSISSWGYAAGQLIVSPTTKRIRLFPRTASSSGGTIMLGPVAHLRDDEVYSIPLDGSREELRRTWRLSPAPQRQLPSCRIPACARGSRS
jgi:3',5'-cyclic AMP phosphodiesterase CpdA